MKTNTSSPKFHVYAALSLLFLALACGRARAATPTVTTAQLTGIWTLVAADDIHPDGSRTAAYGPQPQGLLILDASGYYSLQIYRAERPEFATGDKLRGTAEEYQAGFTGTSAHYGRYTVDADGVTLVFRIEFASFPNLNGKEQRRPFELAGDKLSYRLPATINGIVPVSVWRRVK